MNTETNVHEKLMEHAKKIGEAAEREALWADENSTISETVVGLIKEAQIHRLIIPPEYGYPQIDFTTFAELVKTVGYYNLSAAWLVYFYSLHNAWIPYLPKHRRDEIYASGGLIADIFSPIGRAEKVEGGYILNGRWNYVSGINFSDWVGVGAWCRLPGTDTQKWICFTLHKKDFQIHYDWNCLGLRGSGSNTIIVENCFVPDDMTFELGGMLTDDSPHSDNPGATYIYYNVPFFPAFFVGFPAMAIGGAERALDEFVKGSQSRIRVRSGEQESTTPRSQRMAAEMQIRLSKAKALMKEYIQMLERDKGGLYDMSEYKAIRAGIIDECVMIAQKAVMTLGARALLKGHPLEMILRDMITIGTHGTSLYEDALECLGKHIFGYPNSAQG